MSTSSLAPLQKRAVAFAVDLLVILIGLFTVWMAFWLLLALFTAFLHWVLGLMIGNTPARNVLSAVLHFLWQLVALGFPIVLFGYYFAWMESSRLEASIGKLLLGLRVVDVEGRRLNFKKAMLRSLTKLASAMALCLGFIPAFINPQRQALHDKTSGTLVVTK